MKLRLNHPIFRRFLAPLAAKLVQGLFLTCRKKLLGPPAAMDLLDNDKPLLMTSWHGQLLYALYYYPNRFGLAHEGVIMTSPSRDGAFLGEVMHSLGYIISPGSRRKGGVQALRDLADYFKRGHSVGLVADGSRGPARVAQKGVIFLAREAQAPIVPVAVASSKKVTFNSWDRFELPLPFSRVALLAGEPLWVSPGVRGPELERLRLELETRLNRLFEKSRTYFSR
jgi:lysophospholipid acyltransferase (LPLAT)-like uncharacterized protein